MNTARISALLLAGSALLASCSGGQKSETASSDAMAAKPMNLPYQPSYSSSFEIGNPDYATMIVQGAWKDWEDNKLDNWKNWMADTIVVYHENNLVLKGLDNVMTNWKGFRANLTSVTANLNAVIPVYSTDKKENWVLVWVTEIDTRAGGAVDTIDYMETWRINSAGKADLLMQFSRMDRKK